MSKTEVKRWVEADSLAAKNHAAEIEDQLRAVECNILQQLAHMYRLKAAGKPGAGIPTEIKMEIVIQLTPPAK
jgi:hypothetical protein